MQHQQVVDHLGSRRRIARSRGTPSAAFAAIHALGDALEKGQVRVGARVLRDELERAAALLTRPIAELAISFRTRAVCTLDLPLPATRGTVLVTEGGWQLPLALQDADTLGDVFGSLVAELKSATEGADSSLPR